MWKIVFTTMTGVSLKCLTWSLAVRIQFSSATQRCTQNVSYFIKWDDAFATEMSI